MIKIDGKKWVFLIAFSIINTAVNIALLYIINAFLTFDIDNLPNYLVPVFFCVIVYAFLINMLFQAMLISNSYSLIYDNEIKILEILHNTPLIKFEKYGGQRFYSVLEDLRVFIFFPGVLTTAINSVLMIIICTGYLFWISSGATAILIAFILLMIILYRVINKRFSKKFELLKRLNDDYYKYVDDSLKGFKQLKVSSTQRNNFFKFFLNPNRESAKKTDIELAVKYLIVNLITQYGIYILLGLIFFFLSFFKILDKMETVTYVVALLFLNGPINNLISMQNFQMRAKGAGKRIKLFFNDFGSPASYENNEADHSLTCQTLHFENVSFRYNSEDANAFALKNINFSIEKGETVFIIGGNGSGKSTFINILTGLYQPEAGNILLNNDKVNNNDNAYKQLFSAIFTDSHLFHNNYENYQFAGNSKFEELIKLVKMDSNILTEDKTAIEKKFSKGQSKRVALILALLEDKPIMVLDEWAADQDPHFRKYFYEKLIPKFRADGKTIIAVTHDDTYFKHADRIIKFEYGQIVKEIKVKERPIEDLI